MSLINWYVNTPLHQWFLTKIWRPSWTRFVTMVYGIPSALMVALNYLSSLAGDDKIQTLMAQMHIPDGVFVGLAGIAMVTYIAHGRK